jgi:hypothetical protein
MATAALVVALISSSFVAGQQGVSFIAAVKALHHHTTKPLYHHVLKPVGKAISQ